MISRPIAPSNSRNLDRVLALHNLPASEFEGAVVYDLGSGGSDLGYDLAVNGIHATVTGFDREYESPYATPANRMKTERRFASLDNLPASDESADIVLATYSLPFWAGSPEEISAFFLQATRVVKPQGILSIYPVEVFYGDQEQIAVENEVDKIKTGPWDIVEESFYLKPKLTVRKI